MEALANQFIGLLLRYAGGRTFHPVVAGDDLHVRLAEESVTVCEITSGGEPGGGGKVWDEHWRGTLPGIWCDGARLDSAGVLTEELLQRFFRQLIPHGVLMVRGATDSALKAVLDGVGFDLVSADPGPDGTEYLLVTKRADCCHGGRRVLYDRSNLVD